MEMWERRPWEIPYAERFADRKPRIFLGFVAYGDIDSSVFESCMHWAVRQGVLYKDKFELSIGVATKREQYRARNALVEYAQRQGADFIVMIDDDHTLMDCPNMLELFYNAEKPFQGGLYIQRREDYIQPVIQKYNPVTGACRWITMDELPKESGPVDILGGGINWMDVTIFDFMADPFWWPFPSDERKVFFKPHPRYGLDMQFSIRAKEGLGIQPWLNLDVKIGHLVHERTIMRPPGLEGNKFCDACDGVATWDHGSASWKCQTCDWREGYGSTAEHRESHANDDRDAGNGLDVAPVLEHSA